MKNEKIQTKIGKIILYSSYTACVVYIVTTYFTNALFVLIKNTQNNIALTT